MSLPPDRGHVRTETRHPGSTRLDELSVRACVDLMIDDHATIARAVHDAAGPIEAFIARTAECLSVGGRLVYIGAGTSGRLGVLDAAECPPTFCADPRQVVGVIAGGDTSLRRSSEAREDDPAGAEPALAEIDLGARDVLLGIAAGGTTPYVLGALEIGKARGATTGLLTCAPRAAPPSCDHLLVVDTGPELLTGSTRLRAGSATKLVLNIITTTVFVQLGKVYGNLMVDLRATNDKLRDRAIRILGELCPHLDRPAAAALLEKAGGETKVALLMGMKSVDAETARARLEQANGSLRVALGS